MKNVELRVDCFVFKKLFLFCMAMMLSMSVLTVTTTYAKDSTEDESAYSVESSPYYFPAYSDIKSIEFTQNMLNLSVDNNFYYLYKINDLLKVTTVIPNTTADLTTISYHTGNPDIAFVKGGFLWAKKVGKTWLYAETKNKKVAKILLNVTAQRDKSFIAFTDNKATVGVNQTFKISDYTYPKTYDVYTNGNIPKKNPKLTYRIGNTKVATIDKNGVIKGVGKGNTWAYVKGENGFENRILVNVVDTRKKASSIKLPTSQTVNVDQKIKINATATPTNGIVSWRIGNSKVATVNQSGIVTGVSVGNTYVYAKLANNKEVRSLIKVVDDQPDVVELVYNENYDSEVTSNGTYINVSVRLYDQKHKCTYPFYDYKTLKVTTGNSKIAAVESVKNGDTTDNGIIRIKVMGEGNTWLNVKSKEGPEGKLLLKMKKIPLKKFSLAPEIMFYVNDSVNATTYLSIDAAYRNLVKFRVGNSKVVKLDQNTMTMTGLTAANTYLYAECQGKTVKSLVKVSKPTQTLKSIKFDRSVYNLDAKKSIITTFNLIADPVDKLISKVTFKVGNDKIAEVDQYGTIIGKSNGNTYLYATTETGITTKSLIKVTGLDDLSIVNIPKTYDINLSERESVFNNNECYYGTVTLAVKANSAHCNNFEDLKISVGNSNVAEFVEYYKGQDNNIFIVLAPKSQGNTYLHYKLPNGKTEKTLIKVHW